LIIGSLTPKQIAGLEVTAIADLQALATTQIPASPSAPSPVETQFRRMRSA
jgi:hypothetical protein